MKYVTKEPWCVSTMSGTFVGAKWDNNLDNLIGVSGDCSQYRYQLKVHRVISNVPYVVERGVGDGRYFTSHEAAQDFAFEHGYLQLWEQTDAYRAYMEWKRNKDARYAKINE